MIDVDKFLALYKEEYPALSDDKADGLRFLLEQMNADDKITDPRWISYMLATVKHECAGTWKPIAEYGKGEKREYGKIDKETGQAYYGRGYVQLTWKDNYKAMSSITGHDLVREPDLAMNADIAYKIMSFGMRNGSFTVVGLKKYVNPEKCDFVHARRIINGMDRAETIAEYANIIEAMRREATT